MATKIIVLTAFVSPLRFAKKVSKLPTPMDGQIIMRIFYHFKLKKMTKLC